jgi:hypothetical protein
MVSGAKCKVAWFTAGQAPRTKEFRAVLAGPRNSPWGTANQPSSGLTGWLNGASIQSRAPTVFAAVKVRKRKALVNNAWVRLGHSRCMQLVLEFARICDLMCSYCRSRGHRPCLVSKNFARSSSYRITCMEH